MIESLLLTTVPVVTFDQQGTLTNASGFFFEREQRLFLVTSRHVMLDKPSNHFPDRVEIELHTDADNLADSTGFSIPLYRDGRSVWRQGTDSAGGIDVAVIELDRAALPETMVYSAFTPRHLQDLAIRSKPHTFDGPDGQVTLSDLFADKSQLIIQHVMFDPDWDERQGRGDHRSTTPSRAPRNSLFSVRFLFGFCGAFRLKNCRVILMLGSGRTASCLILRNLLTLAGTADYAS